MHLVTDFLTSVQVAGFVATHVRSGRSSISRASRKTLSNALLNDSDTHVKHGTRLSVQGDVPRISTFKLLAA